MEAHNHIHMIADGSIKRKPGIMLESEGRKPRITHEGGVNRVGEEANIEFGIADEERLQALHNDALAITAGIGGYDVIGVLVDNVVP